MQNDNTKCGLTEGSEGNYTDQLEIDAFVWYQHDWKHDKYEHSHLRHQLTYVEEGYQYFHIAKRTYLVPQHHVIWIPSAISHRISSEANTVNLMTVLFKTVPNMDFYKEVHVFPAPAVLREMLLYAGKWSKLSTEDGEQEIFLAAMRNSLPFFCNDNEALQIPIPSDQRLISVCDYINANYQYSLNLDVLATKAALSVRSLQRIFKKETGITLQKYMQLIRILKSIALIDSKRYTLTQIAYMIGYQSLSAFTSSYGAIMKQRPRVGKSSITEHGQSLPQL